MAKNDKKRAYGAMRNDKKRAYNDKYLSAYAKIISRTSQAEAERLHKEFQTIRDAWEVLEIIRPYISKINFKNYGEAEFVEGWYKNELRKSNTKTRKRNK